MILTKEQKQEEKVIRSKIEAKIYELMNDYKFELPILWNCGACGIAEVYIHNGIMNIKWFDQPLEFINWSENKRGT